MPIGSSMKLTLFLMHASRSAASIGRDASQISRSPSLNRLNPPPVPADVHANGNLRMQLHELFGDRLRDGIDRAGTVGLDLAGDCVGRRSL